MVEKFQLSRKNMADFLMAIMGLESEEPITVLGKAWLEQGEDSITLPDIFKKIIKKSQIGFSINEVVALGNHIEFNHLSHSAVQNWVKRDIKELIGTPQLGKKYTVEQAAILLIVEDLKASLDFDSIRKILNLIFNNPADRTDDIIDPIHFYAAYASIFEKLHHEEILINKSNGPINVEIEQFIYKEAEAVMEHMSSDMTGENVQLVRSMLVTAVTTVISAYYQDLTKKYLKATLTLKESGS